MTPPVYDRINCQTWVVKIEAYVDSSDLWEAIEEEYEVSPLLDNVIVIK